MAKPASKPHNDDPSINNATPRGVDLVAAGARLGALARLDAAMVKAVTGTAERGSRHRASGNIAICRTGRHRLRGCQAGHGDGRRSNGYS